MKMLGRLAAVLAILASVGSLFFANKLDVMKKEHLAKIAELDSNLTKTKSTLAQTQKSLDETKVTLKETVAKLDETNTNLERSKVELATKTQEAETATKQAADMKATLDKATTELTAANEEREKIKTALAKFGGVEKIEEIVAKVQEMVDESKVLKDQLTKMRDDNKTLTAKVEELSTTPIGLRGSVAVAADSWNFVVLSVGHDKRVQPKTQFLIYRDTKLVAKTEVISVGPTTCVAEILPEYRRSAPKEGDLAVH